MFRAAFLACVLVACSSDNFAPGAPPTDAAADTATDMDATKPPQSDSGGGMEATVPDAGTDAQPSDPCATVGAHAYAFVTSVTYQGNFGSVMEGSAICQAAAKNAGLPGGATTGAYVAWLSDTNQSVVSKIKGATTGMAKLVLNDEACSVVADTVPGLLTAPPMVPIDVDETGKKVTSAPCVVWTGTSPDGTRAATALPNINTCGDWSSKLTINYGVAGDCTTTTSPGWTSGSAKPGCDTSGRLYCIQVMAP